MPNTAILALWVSVVSLLVSALTLFVFWRAGRRMSVQFEARELNGKPWLVAIVRNSGGVSAQITGWGIRASRYSFTRYKELPAPTTGSADLQAPASLPYDLPASAYVMLSWENSEVCKKYRSLHASTPNWLRAYVNVGWKRSRIETRFPKRFPKP